ncbi:unnamed protein product [Lupinus luteus]|uniref:Uncharacterized protein n=1 Tax=Lupinus luteus TaxID=3873 RepID=A0AAV1VW66_LUPLU
MNEQPEEKGSQRMQKNPEKIRNGNKVVQNLLLNRQQNSSKKGWDNDAPDLHFDQQMWTSLDCDRQLLHKDSEAVMNNSDRRITSKGRNLSYPLISRKVEQLITLANKYTDSDWILIEEFIFTDKGASLLDIDVNNAPKSDTTKARLTGKAKINLVQLYTIKPDTRRTQLGTIIHGQPDTRHKQLGMRHVINLAREIDTVMHTLAHGMDSLAHGMCTLVGHPGHLGTSTSSTTGHIGRSLAT